jgi:hypothetical protein
VIDIVDDCRYRPRHARAIVDQLLLSELVDVEACEPLLALAREAAATIDESVRS